jgi:asparagine synthetase B (glutamine-hydrolysing)
VDCIFATRGGSRALFEALVREATVDGATTWTDPASGDVRLGAASSQPSVVDHASDASGAVALFGSGVFRSGPDGARRQLETGTVLDGSVEDVVGLTRTARGELEAVTAAGNHRLFVHRGADGAVAVCSQIGVLARALGPDLRVDRSYEDMLLGYGFLPDGRTMYQDVVILPPGTRVALPDGRPDALVPPEQSMDRPQSFEVAAKELHRRFMGAVEDQAGTTRRHAVLLGGLDSVLVATTLERLGHEVHGYTFSFGDPTYEQRNIAAVVAATGISHSWVPITPDAMMDGLEAFGATFAQPGVQPHYQLHTLIASRAIRADGFAHAFSGDGCDAVFLGYPTVSQRARLVERLSRLPSPIASAGHRFLATKFADRHLGHVARIGRSSLANLNLPMPARGHLPTRQLDDVALRRLRVDLPPPQQETITEIRTRLATGLEETDPVRLAFNGNALTGQSRVKVDGATAATGVAQSSPFLHPAVKDFVAALPTSYLRTEGAPAGAAGKELLVRMVRDNAMVPDLVIEQPKQSPSDSPIDAWYMGPLHERLVSLLDGLPFHYDRAYVEEILRPKRAEELFRERVSLAHHTFQAIGLLASYASFTGVTRG